MDGQALEATDNTMDRAACSFGLMLFPDRQKGFKELNRVLHPGGKAMVSGWAGPDKFEGFGLFMGAILKAFPDFPRPATPPPVFSLADPGSFKAEMEAGGFKDVTVEYIDKEGQWNDFDELWTTLTIGAPPIKMLFDQIGDEGKDRVCDALAEIVNERFGNGMIQVNNTATVGVGTAI
jgi:SAM-dependent methyltransferase